MKLTSIWVAVVTLETVTPLTIGTGRGDDLRDSICVSDANGLPTLPGTSLAGALRSHWANSDDLFGFQHRDGEGHRSRLTVGWGSIHDANDCPVPFRADKLAQDEVLGFLGAGVTRDHVRISVRGAVDGAGKFDETLVPRGARFSLELRIDNPKPGESTRLLSLLSSPLFRLGGRTRRGYGRVSLVRVHENTFSLPTDQSAWAAYARILELEKRQQKLPKWTAPPDTFSEVGMEKISIRMTSEDHWLVGGGEPTESDKLPGMTKTADMIPVRERYVEWKTEPKQDRGRVKEAPVAYLPGSSLKGVLRHRTAFHLRRIRGKWADEFDTQELLAQLPGKEPSEPKGLDALFGKAKDSEESSNNIAGKVFIADAVVKQERVAFQNHVAIDRFSGAPLSGCLFNEAPLYKSTLNVEIVLNTKGVDDKVLSAFQSAIRDLKRGRLAVGGGSNRGHGYFWAEGERR